MPEIGGTVAAAATPNPREMAFLLLGASMLTSSIRKSETAAIDRARRGVLNRAHQWRARARSVSSVIEAMVGAFVVGYTIWQILHREFVAAEVALGLGAGTLADEPSAPSVPTSGVTT